MKKLVLFSVLIELISLYSPSIFADPTLIAIEFTCPSATGSGPGVLSRYPTRLSGYGTETLNGQPSFNSPYFNYNIQPGDNIPMSLSTYSNSGTGFDPATGLVSCSFSSSGEFSPFTTVYQMVNAAGGQIAAQTLNSITINQFLGVKSNSPA